jgi:hypothetical protein
MAGDGQADDSVYMNDTNFVNLQPGNQTDSMSASQSSESKWTELEWFAVWLQLARPPANPC